MQINNNSHQPNFTAGFVGHTDEIMEIGLKGVKEEVPQLYNVAKTLLTDIKGKCPDINIEGYINNSLSGSGLTTLTIGCMPPCSINMMVKRPLDFVDKLNVINAKLSYEQTKADIDKVLNNTKLF